MVRYADGSSWHPNDDLQERIGSCFMADALWKAPLAFLEKAYGHSMLYAFSDYPSPNKPLLKS
jgi:hypothetical protein